MTKRQFVTGLLGGLVMFAWTSIAHVALPLGRVGIREIPNEKSALVALSSSIGRDSGLYLYPAMGSETAEQYAQKLTSYPSGLLIYHPPGASMMTVGQLVTELVTEILESLLIVWLLAHAMADRFKSRVGLATVLGVLASMVTNVSYWNWYGFPLAYTAASMFVQVVGFVLAGLVAASRAAKM